MKALRSFSKYDRTSDGIMHHSKYDRTNDGILQHSLVKIATSSMKKNL